jgi:hypothetical protein
MYTGPEVKFLFFLLKFNQNQNVLHKFSKKGLTIKILLKHFLEGTVTGR